MPWSRSSRTANGFQLPLYGAACLSKFECYQMKWQTEYQWLILIQPPDHSSWHRAWKYDKNIREFFVETETKAMYSQFRVAQAVGNLWPGGSFPAVGPPIPTSSALQDSKRLKNHTMGPWGYVAVTLSGTGTFKPTSWSYFYSVGPGGWNWADTAGWEDGGQGRTIYFLKSPVLLDFYITILNLPQQNMMWLALASLLRGLDGN